MKMIQKIKKIFLTKKFGSFFIIGLINTFSAQLLYIIFVLGNIMPGTSSILSDVLTMFISYFLNIRFTYKIKPSLKTLIPFPISYIPGWIINFLMVIFCVNVLGVGEIWAKLASIPITVPLNFIVMSYVMKTSSKDEL